MPSNQRISSDWNIANLKRVVLMRSSHQMKDGLTHIDAERM
jgi:hypothetical protein